MARVGVRVRVPALPRAPQVRAREGAMSLIVVVDHDNDAWDVRQSHSHSRPIPLHCPQLLQLPPVYQNLFLALSRQPCHACGQRRSELALCLVCGLTMCVGEGNCSDPAGECLWVWVWLCVCMCVRVNRRRIPTPHLTIPHPTLPLSERRGRCSAHAAHCGASAGVFLLAEHTQLLALRSHRACFMPSPYLDSYGEEDQGLRRGRLLSLR